MTLPNSLRRLALGANAVPKPIATSGVFLIPNMYEFWCGRKPGQPEETNTENKIVPTPDRSRAEAL